MQCPKCHANMRTFDRMGVHIEQCEGCRGLFLDYGELESIVRLETQVQAPPPPVAPAPPPVAYPQPVQPGWGAVPPAHHTYYGGHHGGHHYGGHHGGHHGLARLFFSS